MRIIGKQQLASPKDVNEERSFPVITVLVTSLSLSSPLSLLRDSLQSHPHPMTLPNAGMLVAGQTFYSLLLDYKFCCAVLYPRLHSRDLQRGEHLSCWPGLTAGELELLSLENSPRQKGARPFPDVHSKRSWGKLQ